MHGWKWAMSRNFKILTSFVHIMHILLMVSHADTKLGIKIQITRQKERKQSSQFVKSSCKYLTQSKKIWWTPWILTVGFLREFNFRLYWYVNEDDFDGKVVVRLVQHAGPTKAGIKSLLLTFESEQYFIAIQYIMYDGFINLAEMILAIVSHVIYDTKKTSAALYTIAHM